ncbi:MAG: DUF6624 domain-containing protein [Bacteroidota bacterium]
MKKLLLFSFVVFSAFFSAYAQTPTKYFLLTREAKLSLDKKDYKKSALLYGEAFKANAGKAFYQDRYNAACSNAMAGYKDSAFYQLFKIAELYDYSDYDTLTKAPHFISLHGDKRWNEVLNKVKQNIGKTETKLNKALVVLLDSVYREDQTSRLQEVSIKNEFGTGSHQAKEILKTIKQKDSINLFIVLNVIEKYGWLGRDIVGGIGNSALSLVLQRTELKIQEKYLPVMREAFKKDDVDVYDLAAMEDIVALKQGKKQIYGSQLKKADEKKYYILPIEEPEAVNERRAKIGLNTMNDYLQNWRMAWDINGYKKDLLVIEEKKIHY